MHLKGGIGSPAGEPRISVITPVFNGERYLGDAIESVLAQTLPPAEVIVVDDGSTDESGTVAGRYASAVSYCRQPNSGTAAARNLGIERAQGDHIAHLDADDMWTADKLALQVEAFRATPDLDAVFGHITEFASPDVETEGIRVRTEPAPSYSPCTILIERKALRRVGPYRTKWQIGQDMDWHMRAHGEWPQHDHPARRRTVAPDPRQQGHRQTTPDQPARPDREGGPRSSPRQPLAR